MIEEITTEIKNETIVEQESANEPKVVRVTNPLSWITDSSQKRGSAHEDGVPSGQPSRNPLAKKLLEFHHEKIGKFSVRDLFKS